MSTDVTGTLETTNVVGNSGAAPTGTAGTASVRDTTPTGGAGGGDNNKTATQPDTSGAVAGSDGAEEDYSQGTVSQNLDTGSGGGSPIQHADPAYRAPSGDVPAGELDTTRTDTPISDGSEPDETHTMQSGNLDTVNFKPVLQTTTTNLPVAPAAPAVAAGNRSVTVTITEVADPAGAKVRGYRVEGTTGGVDFAPRNPNGATTVVVITNLVPNQVYKFRAAAVNDNGQSAFSAFSAEVTPLNPEAGDGVPDEVTPENLVNPIYSPDGTTVGLPGPVRNLVAVPGSAAGEVDVSWDAPAWGSAPTGYEITASSSEDDTTDDETFEVTLTGLDFADLTTITVVATSALGDGRPAISDPVFAIGPVTTLAAVTGGAAGEIDVTWEAPEYGTPTGYRITAEGEDPVEVDAETLEVTLEDLTVATEFDVEVVAFDADGDGVATVDTATSHA